MDATGNCFNHIYVGEFKNPQLCDSYNSNNIKYLSIFLSSLYHQNALTFNGPIRYHLEFFYSSLLNRAIMPL